MSDAARAVVVAGAAMGAVWLWKRRQAAQEAESTALPNFEPYMRDTGGGFDPYAYSAANQPRLTFDPAPVLAFGLDALIGALQGQQNTGGTPPIIPTTGGDMNRSKSTNTGTGGLLGRIFGIDTGGNGSTQKPVSGSAQGYFDKGLPPSIIGTESGGNPMAYNNEKGAGGFYGHGGRGQFGTARLQDAYRAGALDRPMTAAEFARAPLAVQERVEAWHVRDIGNYIERNNLDRYIGQTVGGVEVTLNGMIAAAHLGGSGGLRRWLESGGARNPSDSFGTSLTDYMRTHWGWG